MNQNYLNSARKEFTYYKSLGDKTFAQLKDEQLFLSIGNESNSIAIIVKHMWGNMRSRWTDFLTTDGEKSWRNRDSEFEDSIQTRKELLDKWEEGWECVFNALDSINPEDYQKKILIRNMEHTLPEAINRQIAHYAYHVGQITFIGKALADNWKALSIPKGKSQEYNEKKFSQQTKQEHYSEDFLSENEKS